MTLYYRYGEHPTELPHRIRLVDGSTRTDPTTFTDEEISSAGYFVAPEKPNNYDLLTEKVVWQNDRWIIETLSDREIDILREKQYKEIEFEIKELTLNSYKIYVSELNKPEQERVHNLEELKAYIEDLENIIQTYDGVDFTWPTYSFNDNSNIG
jgi:hypothetical protein